MKTSSLLKLSLLIGLGAFLNLNFVHAATKSSCEKKAQEIKKYCEDLVKETTSQNNSDIKAYENTLNPNGQGGIVNTAISDPALQQQRINEISAARAKDNAKKCAEREKECKQACDASSAPPQDQQAVKSTGELCKKDVKKNKDAMDGAGKQAKDNAEGSGKTGDQAGSQQGQGGQQGGQQGGSGGQPPGDGAPPQSPQQSPQQQAEKPTTMPGTEATEKKEAVDCSKTQFASVAECKGKQKEQVEYCQQDENKNKPTCNTPEMKTASFCSSNSQCPSCKGMSAQSLASASQSELQSMCNSTCMSDPQLGPNLADKCRAVVAKTGTQSVGGGGSSGGGGGGGGSSGASGTLATLDGQKFKLNDVQGSREGGSLGVDAAGGFSGYGDKGGSGFGSSDAGGSSGMGGASPASAAGGGLVANAKDIERQNGFSVTRIVSDVLRSRCEKGRFLHCGP